ncbi:MAG: glycosyltransferase family 9 protein [Gammaproteobacteria bacterium]|nr:glycosyltransferase family 9 protein [Gammaproteobacteria bacterium]
MTTPSLAALKRTWPDCLIDTVSAPCATEVFSASPEVRHAYSMQRNVASMRTLLRAVRARRYDLLIDYHASPRTFWISALSGIPVRLSHDRKRINWRSLAYNVHGREVGSYSAAGRLDLLRPLGVAPVDLTPRFPVNARARCEAEKFLTGTGIPASTPLVAISSSSRHETQVWPRECWKLLVIELNRRWGIRCIAVAPPGDPQRIAELEQETGGLLKVAAPSNLAFLAAILARADALVCDCSAPRHFAVSQGTPSLTIIGGSMAGVWKHPSDMHQEIFSDLPCRPCAATTCRLGDVPCMSRLSVEKVLSSFADLRACIAATEIVPEKQLAGLPSSG